MPNADQNLIKLKAHIAENIPGFEVKAKNESKFVKFLSYLLFFNKGFMTRYILGFLYQPLLGKIKTLYLL